MREREGESKGEMKPELCTRTETGDGYSKFFSGNIIFSILINSEYLVHTLWYERALSDMKLLPYMRPHWEVAAGASLSNIKHL